MAKKENKKEVKRQTVKVFMENWNVAKILEMTNSNNIELDYHVQRNSVYTKKDRQKLMEVILSGNFCGIMHLSLHQDKKYYSIDGKQRSITLQMFTNNEFTLLEGNTFKELSKENSKFLLDYAFPVVIYEGLTEEEEVMLFESLNGKYGKKLTASELIKNHLPEELRNLESHPFWEISNISKTKINRFEPAEILLQTAMLLQADNPRIDLNSDSQADFLSQITNDTIMKLTESLNFITESIEVKERLLKRINIPIILKLASYAIDKKHSSLHFCGFLQKFFNSQQWVNEYDAYSAACSSGTSKAGNVNIRYNSLFNAYNKCKAESLAYTIPESKKAKIIKDKEIKALKEENKRLQKLANEKTGKLAIEDVKLTKEMLEV